MFERALSLRRKLLRALKMHFGLGKSSGSLPRKPKSEMEVLGLEPAEDGVPQIKYTPAQSDFELITAMDNGTAPEIDAIPLRESTSKYPLTIVVPPKTPVPDLAQSPLSTPESRDHADHELSQTSPKPAISGSNDSSRVERFQRMQQQLQRRAIVRARSLPLSVSDPMRKLRDSYVRIMHKMAQDEAKANSLAPASALFVVSDQSRVFNYLHRRRSPADDEEEEFCRLAVMRTKLNRSQSAL